MDGWTSEGEGICNPYSPMEKGEILVDIESCLRCDKKGFAMGYISVMSSDGWDLKGAAAFGNTDDLLCKLMDLSLTCSIANIGSVLDDQMLIITLVQTDDSTTNIDADVMDAISKLRFKG